MKIGKTITIVTSPQRVIKKAGETKKEEAPIPVEIPKKKEAEVESFKFIGHMWGLDKGSPFGDKTGYFYTSAT